MDLEKLAERLLPGEYPSLESIENRYPPRDLPAGAEVTRLAPSPTGFIHLGNLFVAIANERIAHLSGGTLYLRIEDTDLKRKVDGAVEAVIAALDYFDIRFDEGAEIEGAETVNADYAFTYDFGEDGALDAYPAGSYSSTVTLTYSYER